jgi:Ca2+-binding EF-hand superfamily protein
MTGTPGATKDEKEKGHMGKNVGLKSTIALAMMTLASAACYADDKKTDLPGPIDSLSDIQDTANLIFKLADTNNDNQISKKEATDAGNLLVGGFFFRADTNGDGVLTEQEAVQARDSLFAQQPLLRLVIQKANPKNGPQANQPQANPENVQPIASGAAVDPANVVKSLAADPMKTLENLLDTNRDRKIEATELRQAVQTGVSALFLVADTNQDSQLSSYELNAALGEVIKSAVQTAFQAADNDRNNVLSVDEFDKAWMQPAHAVFRVLDANDDNQLSMDELQRAEQIVADQIERLRVPNANRSMSNQTPGSRRAYRPAQLSQPVQAQPGEPATGQPTSVQPAPSVAPPR